MIIYDYSFPALILIFCIITFVLGYGLGVTEKRVNRKKDYWQGYTDCMNENKSKQELFCTEQNNSCTLNVKGDSLFKQYHLAEEGNMAAVETCDPNEFDA